VIRGVFPSTVHAADRLPTMQDAYAGFETKMDLHFREKLQADSEIGEPGISAHDEVLGFCETTKQALTTVCRRHRCDSRSHKPEYMYSYPKHKLSAATVCEAR